MFKGLVTSEQAEDITKDYLLKVAQDIIDIQMNNFSGFISWEIHFSEDDKYTNIESCKSKVDAKNTELAMMKTPNVGNLFACFKEGSINSAALKSVKRS